MGDPPLTRQHEIPWVAIDETVGRRFARLSGLTVTGSIGILLRAKTLGYPLVYVSGDKANASTRYLA